MTDPKPEIVQRRLEDEVASPSDNELIRRAQAKTCHCCLLKWETPEMLRKHLMDMLAGINAQLVGIKT